MDSNSVNITVEMIKALPTIAASVAATTASIVAIYGIGAWRREFKGKRQIELSENVLALFYQARDAIRAIRSPFGYAGEGTTRKPGENETKEQKEARDRAHVVTERFKKNQEVFNKLYSLRYRFMAEIGKDKAEPFDEIRRIISDISVAAFMLPDLWAPRRWQYYNEKKQEELFMQREKYEAIFWEGVSEKDEINKRVDKAISDIEKTCKSIIMGKSTK